MINAMSVLADAPEGNSSRRSSSKPDSKLGMTMTRLPLDLYVHRDEASSDASCLLLLSSPRHPPDPGKNKAVRRHRMKLFAILASFMMICITMAD